MPDHIIEVKPTGPTSGDIVWEWHAWDHLIQDYDSSKANYGVVEDHPELIDINYGAFFMSTMIGCIQIPLIITHNSIKYFSASIISMKSGSSTIARRPRKQQVILVGDSGKGGDLLYRWGNPQAYAQEPQVIKNYTVNMTPHG